SWCGKSCSPTAPADSLRAGTTDASPAAGATFASLEAGATCASFAVRGALAAAGSRAIGLCVLGRKREPIEAALPDHALAADIAAHQLGELARDGKPETSHFAEIGVDLDARLKQTILHGFAQANAGVDDVESELEAAIVLRSAGVQSD